MKKSKLSGSTDVWLGWSHLFKPFDGLMDPSVGDLRLDIAQLEADQEDLLAVVQKVVPEILAVETRNLSLSISVVKDIMFSLGEAASAGRGFIVKRRFLEILQAGNSTGRFAQAPYPYLPAPPPNSPPSPFLQEKFENLVMNAPFFSAFIDSLKDGDPLEPDAWWGCVLLSAMTFGALLETSALLGLPLAIKGADPKLRWLMIGQVPASSSAAEENSDKNANGKRREMPRRWFIDPITRMLWQRRGLSNIPEMPILDRVSYHQVHKLIRAYASKRGFEKLVPKGIAPIRNALVTQIHLHMPPWIIEYAVGTRRSASMPEWAWQRLVVPQAGFVATLTPRERPWILPRAGAESEDEDQLAEQQTEWPTQLRQLASVLLDRSPELRKRVQQWLNVGDEHRLRSVQVIGEWVAKWLLTRGRSRNVLKPRTVYQLFNAAAGRLVGQLGGINLAELGSEEAYIEVYQTALEDVPSINVRRRVARALKSLHEFMVSTYDGVPPLSDGGVFVVTGSGSAMADANVVSVDTFMRALTWLESEANQRYGVNISKQLKFIALLGYYSSLRRSEAIGLDLQSLDTLWGFRGRFDVVETWLDVSANSLRGLKTRAGHRYEPLALLVPRPLLVELLEWYGSRVAESDDLSAPLFPDFVKRGSANDKDPRLALIAVALQYAADDETLRYNHLRHSFASWTGLLFWLAEQDGRDVLPEWFAPTELDQARLAMAKPLREAILGKALTSRRAMLVGAR